MTYESPAENTTASKELTEKAYDSALKKSAIVAINIDHFRGTYPDEEIDKDLMSIKNRDQNGAKKDRLEQILKKKATVLEIIFAEQLSSHKSEKPTDPDKQPEELGWLGENVLARITTKYDDYENHVDIVLEFKDPENKDATYLTLAIDVTFNEDPGPKLDRVKEGIDSGKLATVKYFVPGAPEKSNKIPMVVIGVSRAAVDDLMQMWLDKDLVYDENKNSGTQEQSRENIKRHIEQTRENAKYSLFTHSAQDKILGELKFQLGAFAEYAERTNKPDITDKYKKALWTIERIIRDRERNILEGDYLGDEVFNTIYTYAHNLNESAKPNKPREDVSEKRFDSPGGKTVILRRKKPSPEGTPELPNQLL